MCHPGVSFVNREGLMVYRRWLVFRVAEHAPRQVHGGGSSGEGASKNRCVCSPSKHPGSFRCRQHHGEYVWRGRAMK
ncbi:hypothetical protein VNO77_33011 [Canavalia gladiata]|uniref:Uncharacterized protein n=1 Tax=Canavalia gladiata TaxID=3824 RepID=A0AAN9KDJ3_CANGL